MSRHADPSRPRPVAAVAVAVAITALAFGLFRLLGADGVAIPQDTVEISGQLGSENREPPALQPVP